jgi:DNA-binding MarR family transcriptional regulator
MTEPEDAAPPLPRLLALAYSHAIDGLHERLADRGWRDVRPSYGYVLLAARDQPMTTSELAGFLGVTKQAASKLVEGMVAADYVERRPHPVDARAQVVGLTRRGRRLLRTVEAVYRELEADWAGLLGADRLEDVRAALTDVLRARHGEALPPIRPV